MKTFFDTSAFAKRFIQENGSAHVEEICQQTTELGLSIVCIPELISAMNRRRREKVLSDDDYEKIKTTLTNEIKDATIVNITNSVISHSTKLLESNILRAMDSLHIACAMEWNAEAFVTADKQQLEAARRAGLSAILVG